MSEIFLRRTPESDPKALAFLRESPEVFVECLKRNERMDAARKELTRIHELPVTINPQKYLDHQKTLYAESVFAAVVKFIHYGVNRRPKTFAFCASDRLADMVFALMPAETIEAACKVLVTSDGAVTDAEREKLKGKANKEIETGKKYIIAKIPVELLQDGGHGDFIHGPLYVAYLKWTELQRTFGGPVDPWGMACPVESPWKQAHSVLGFQPNHDGGRFEPTEYDPDFHKETAKFYG